MRYFYMFFGMMMVRIKKISWAIKLYLFFKSPTNYFLVFVPTRLHTYVRICTRYVGRYTDVLHFSFRSIYLFKLNFKVAGLSYIVTCDCNAWLLDKITKISPIFTKCFNWPSSKRAKSLKKITYNQFFY